MKQSINGMAWGALLLLLTAMPVQAQQEIYGNDYAAPSSYPSPTPSPTAAPVRSSGTVETYMETRVSDLETQLRGMNGRLEQAEWQNRKLQSQLDKAQGDIELRLQALEQAKNSASSAPAPVITPSPNATVPPRKRGSLSLPNRSDATADTIDQLAVDDGAVEAGDTDAPPAKPVTGRLGTLRMSDGQIKGADDDAVTPPLPKPPVGYGATPQEQYDQAFSLIRNQDYAGAEAAFKGFISKNPKHKLTDSAKYWLGESYYGRGQYDTAAVTFADAYQAAPKSAKAPDSLYKLGMALAGLKKTDDACTTLAEVGTRYPNATSVKARADQEIKKLKCKN